jgi:N-acyl-D-amino-acid deacylase
VPAAIVPPRALSIRYDQRPSSIGSARRGEMRNDLPGGGRRIVMPASGIEHVIVNGQTLYDQGRLGDTLPGKVLRSGNC